MQPDHSISADSRPNPLPAGEGARQAADAASKPRIGPGFRLQWEEVQQAHVLLYPEGMVKLNPTAGEIIKRCDGRRSVSEIVAELERAFNAGGLEADVLAFVEMAGKQRWLAW